MRTVLYIAMLAALGMGFVAVEMGYT